MSRAAFSGDHLTDEEKREQANRCLDILSTADQSRFTNWEEDFYFSILNQKGEIVNWTPSYRQLNRLKDMVEKYA